LREKERIPVASQARILLRTQTAEAGSSPTRITASAGGLYHNFRDRDDLLDQLIALWEQTCRLLPDDQPGGRPSEAADWLDRVFSRLIDSDDYDHRFDLAVRDWARADQRAAWAVERADRERLLTLTKCFEILGYDDEEVPIRARVLYYHQIGYYAIGVRQGAAERPPA
jgi:hypothetical protein